MTGGESQTRREGAVGRARLRHRKALERVELDFADLVRQHYFKSRELIRVEYVVVTGSCDLLVT